MAIKMNIHQYLELERGNLTLKQISDNNKIEKFATWLNRPGNERALKAFTLMIAFSIHYTKAQAAAQDAAAQAKGKMYQARDYIAPIIIAGITGICVIKCLVDIGKAVLDGKKNDMGSIVMRYVFYDIIACAIPGIFALINSFFGV